MKDKENELDKKYYFFWGGPFSNWHPSWFDVDGIDFNCGEQYFMYVKAMTFGDTETADKILKETEPRKQKALGRQVKNFDPEMWDDVCYELIKKGLRAKFLQNPDLYAELISHKDELIVEASPQDRMWGIGFSKFDALANKDNWGKNLLGKILTTLAWEFSGKLVYHGNFRFFKIDDIENIYLSEDNPEGELLYKDDKGHELRMTFDFIDTLTKFVEYIRNKPDGETVTKENWIEYQHKKDKHVD